MSIEDVRFASGSCSLSGTLWRPDIAERAPVVVQGPGWLGLRDAKLYQPYHEALVAAGIAVFAFDYQGFGDSEGDASYLDPASQVIDWISAVNYVDGRPDLDRTRIGAFGSGGTGGGNAVVVAASDPRIKATVSQVPVSDGRDWLHRMRREHEWIAFLHEIDADRQRIARGGLPTFVSPREGIAVPTPERNSTTVKSDVDGRVPSRVQLASAEAILRYRPIDYVERIAPRAIMLICVERDATTPEDHTFALFEKAGAPKRLVIQTETTHYAAYAQYRGEISALIVDWFRRHMGLADTQADEGSDVAVIRLTPKLVASHS